MDSLNQDLLMVLRNLLTQLPSLLTSFVCLLIAIIRWKRHPKVSLVASLGLILLILHGLFFSAAYIWIPRVFVSGSFQENPRFFSLLALTTNFLFAVALATFLAAVFIDRKRTSG
jgi:hypothetical protein